MWVVERAGGAVGGEGVTSGKEEGVADSGGSLDVRRGRSGSGRARHATETG